MPSASFVQYNARHPKLFPILLPRPPRMPPKTVFQDNQLSFHRVDTGPHEWIDFLNWSQIEEKTGIGIGFDYHSCVFPWILNSHVAKHTSLRTFKSSALNGDKVWTVVVGQLNWLLAIKEYEKESLSSRTTNSLSCLDYTTLPPDIDLPSQQP